MAFDSAPNAWVLKDIGDRLAEAQKTHDQLGTGGNVYSNDNLALLNRQQVGQLTDPWLQFQANRQRDLEEATGRMEAHENANAMDVYDGPGMEQLAKLAKLISSEGKAYNDRKRTSATRQGYR